MHVEQNGRSARELDLCSGPTVRRSRRPRVRGGRKRRPDVPPSATSAPWIPSAVDRASRGVGGFRNVRSRGNPRTRRHSRRSTRHVACPIALDRRRRGSLGSQRARAPLTLGLPRGTFTRRREPTADRSPTLGQPEEEQPIATTNGPDLQDRQTRLRTSLSFSALGLVTRAPRAWPEPNTRPARRSRAVREQPGT